jgi:flagellar assembly protein FliH
LSKVIKKFVELDEPVVIVKGSKKPASSVKSETVRKLNPQSLAFSELIHAEIEEHRKKITGQLKSREELHAQEIDKSFQEGYEKGLTDGIERERADRIKSIEALLAETKKKSEQVIRGLEVKVIELAATIAEKIIRKSVAADPSQVEHIVEETLSDIIGSEMVVLKVSPEDYQNIHAKYDRWLGMAGVSGEFRIEIDKRLRPGDCLVETESGIIDSVVSDRIDVLVEELLKVSQ